MPAGWTALIASVLAMLGAAPADAAVNGCDPGNGPRLVFDGKSSERHHVSITFDEYLDPGITPHLLRVFDRFDMAGTFFTVGANAAHYPSLAASVVEHGNELGNHSWSHIDLTEQPDSGLSEYGKTQQAIVDATGFEPCLARPPFGAFNESVLDSASHYGMRTVLWSVFPWKQRHSSHRTARYVLRHIRPGAIVLLHQTPSNADALRPILRGLERKGLRSVPAVRLLGGHFLR